MEKLSQAITYVKSGEKVKGKKLLVEVIRSNPQNETAWLWMAVVIKDKNQRRQCLEKVLGINPNNEQARTELAKMMRRKEANNTQQSIRLENDKEPKYRVETGNVYSEKKEFGPSAKASKEAQFDKYALQAKIKALKEEQVYDLGVLGGLFGGGIGAVIWAVITYITEYQIGYMAAGVGLLVGYGVRLLGKGIDKIYGITGGVIAFFSVALGNFLSSIGFLAKVWDVGYLEALLSFDYTKIFELMAVGFSPIDILFYGIAIYEGYRFSFRKISSEDLLRGTVARK